MPVCFRSPKVCYKCIAKSYPCCVISGGRHLHKCILHDTGFKAWGHGLMNKPIWLKTALAFAYIGLHMSCGFAGMNQFFYSAWFRRSASAGCGEWRMVMGCGVAPRGSLRLTHLAAKLTPTISGGPCMPVSC